MRIVIIGAGAAGMSACRELILLSGGAAESCVADISVTILSKEKYYPYYRPSLSKCCRPNQEPDITNYYLQNPSWFAKNHVRLLLATIPTAIDFEKKVISTSRKEKYNYDKLIICSGSNSVKLPNINYDQQGIFSLIDYDDIQRINSYIRKNSIQKALIIGGGILGCESANLLHEFQIKTTIIEMQNQIMPALLTRASAWYMQSILEKKGVTVYLKALVEQIVFDKTTSKLEIFLKGEAESIMFDLVIINVGVRANWGCLNPNTIKINRGIICNYKLETSVANVYAAGDVAEIKGLNSVLLWEPAVIQGKIVAQNILKPSAPLLYDQAQKYVTLYQSFKNIHLCVYGNQHDITADDELLIIDNIEANQAQKSFIHYNPLTNKIVFVASFNNPAVRKLIFQLKENENLITIENFKQI